MDRNIDSDFYIFRETPKTPQKKYSQKIHGDFIKTVSLPINSL